MERQSLMLILPPGLSLLEQVAPMSLWSCRQSPGSSDIVPVL